MYIVYIHIVVVAITFTPSLSVAQRSLHFNKCSFFSALLRLSILRTLASSSVVKEQQKIVAVQFNELWPIDFLVFFPLLRIPDFYTLFCQSNASTKKLFNTFNDSNKTKKLTILVVAAMRGAYFVRVNKKIYTLN